MKDKITSIESTGSVSAAIAEILNRHEDDSIGSIAFAIVLKDSGDVVTFASKTNDVFKLLGAVEYIKYRIESERVEESA